MQYDDTGAYVSSQERRSRSRDVLSRGNAIFPKFFFNCLLRHKMAPKKRGPSKIW